MSSLITCAGEGVGQPRSQKPRRLGQLSPLRLGQLAPEEGNAAVLLSTATGLKSRTDTENTGHVKARATSITLHIFNCRPQARSQLPS